MAIASRRFHSTLVERRRHFLEVASLHLLDPCVPASARLEDWPWSSYPATIRSRRSRRFLSLEPILELFSRDGPPCPCAPRLVPRRCAAAVGGRFSHVGDCPLTWLT